MQYHRNTKHIIRTKHVPTHLAAASLFLESVDKGGGVLFSHRSNAYWSDANGEALLAFEKTLLEKQRATPKAKKTPTSTAQKVQFNANDANNANGSNTDGTPLPDANIDASINASTNTNTTYAEHIGKQWFLPANSSVGAAYRTPLVPRYIPSPNANSANGFQFEGIAWWGWGNNAPQMRSQMAEENNIVPQILRTYRNIIMGGGVRPFEKYINEKGELAYKAIDMPPEIAAWHENNETDDQLETATNDLVKHAQFLVQYRRKNDAYRRKDFSIDSYKVQPCNYMRSGWQDEQGNVTAWYYNGYWGHGFPMFNPTRTIKIPTEQKGTWQPTFVVRFGDSLFDDGYYYIPIWQGAMDWIELANMIPRFHISNLNNGLTPRWHIEFPNDYFIDKVKYPNWNDVENMTDEEYLAFVQEQADSRAACINYIKGVLAGIEKAGETIFTDYEIDELNSKMPKGIKITPLKSELNHDAFVKLFDTTNIANISAHGIPPVVAAIQTANRMSAGAEIRNSLWLVTILNTPHYRKKLLKALYERVHNANGWAKKYPNLVYRFVDIEITKLDENKQGTQAGTQNETTPQ